jgi:hypothetical protein
MRRSVLLLPLAWLSTACAASIYTSSSVTYMAPATPAVDSLAILPVSSGEGLEGFRRMISDSLFAILGRERREIVLLPAETTLARINRAGLTNQYATAIRDYQQTSVLTRTTIDSMSRAIGTRYLLYTRAAYAEGNAVSDVVWEALANGKVSAGEFETSRGIDEILAASVRELVAKFLARPAR